MADKEATIFILDLGSSMAQTHSGRAETDLDWGMRYFWDKVTDIVAANRKTLCVGIVGLRTDETSNKLMEDDGYENIAVLQELGPMTMESLKALQPTVKPSNTSAGDAISAIVVAVDMMDTFTKKLKWTRKIVLITDGLGEVDGDDLDDIAKKMNDSKIQLTVLYVRVALGNELPANWAGAWTLTMPNTALRKRISHRPRQRMNASFAH
jgi:ATP-dependent DNA helicase 2 subunit 2